MKLSLKQKKLAKLLAINARFSNADIGHTLGISADTVEYQINKLVKKEKLGEFVTLFDYRAIGYEHYQYSQLKTYLS